MAISTATYPAGWCDRCGEQVSPGHAHVPYKPCGCGVLAGEDCDCDAIYAWVEYPMSVTEQERQKRASEQVRLLTGGHPEHPDRCYAWLSDWWASEADMCQNVAVFAVVVDDYRTGIAVDGQFTPGELRTQVCIDHEFAVRAAPGWVSSTPIRDVKAV